MTISIFDLVFGSQCILVKMFSLSQMNPPSRVEVEGICYLTACMQKCSSSFATMLPLGVGFGQETVATKDELFTSPATHSTSTLTSGSSRVVLLVIGPERYVLDAKSTFQYDGVCVTCAISNLASRTVRIESARLGFRGGLWPSPDTGSQTGMYSTNMGSPVAAGVDRPTEHNGNDMGNGQSPAGGPHAKKKAPSKMSIRPFPAKHKAATSVQKTPDAERIRAIFPAPV